MMSGFMSVEYREFTGAFRHYDDDGKEYYEARGPIAIRRSAVESFYDHTIVLQSGKAMRVMEGYDEIMKRLD